MDFTGAPEAPERFEGGGTPAGGPFLLVLGGLGVDEIYGDCLKADFLDIGEAGYRAGGVVIVRSAGIARIGSVEPFVKGTKNLGSMKGGHIEEAAPDFGRRKATHCKAGNDAEVVTAAFKGAPEIRVG